MKDYNNEYIKINTKEEYIEKGLEGYIHIYFDLKIKKDLLKILKENKEKNIDLYLLYIDFIIKYYQKQFTQDEQEKIKILSKTNIKAIYIWKLFISNITRKKSN